MHNYVVPDQVSARVRRRRGSQVFQVNARRSALIVIDMQNYFVAEEFPLQVPCAREIVPAINAAAAAMRAAGGRVIWVQTTATGALKFWANHHKRGMDPEVAKRRLAGLDEEGEGFKLYQGLDVMPGDVRIKKIKFSALAGNSSDLHQVLIREGIETVFIAGTLTNVCCESTARDAMMLDYQVVMLSDGNASLTDEEHAAALNTFQAFFGTVMTTSEAIDCLTAKA